jgi:beta-glucanase (GH16 family)
MPEKITSIKEFHKYGLEWDEDNIKWYWNDQLIRSVEKKVIIEASVNKKIFEEDFYIVVNLAAGGLFDNWYRPNPTDLPCKMLVKDVKYYIFD